MTEKEVSSDTNGKEENTHDPSELETAIIKQVEHYFGDINLPRDKFLSEQVKLDEGWVPLDVLITFKRLAKLTMDLEAIANAVSKSATGLLEVSEDNKKIRRNPELPPPEMNEERRKQLMSRCLYFKGFPKDYTMDDLMTYFKEVAEVEHVFMRKYLDKVVKKRMFKGSVFVTFKSQEQADKILVSNDLKVGDTTLLIKKQEDYLQGKQQEWQDRREKKEKKVKTDKKEPEIEKTKEPFSLPTGAVLKFVDADEKITRELIKEALTALGADVTFINYKIGDKDGNARLATENSAKEIFDKMADGKLKIGDAEMTFSILEGDEEKAYLEKTIEEMSKRRQHQHKNKRGNWHNKGKFQGSRKRKQGPHNEGPKQKIAST